MAARPPPTRPHIGIRQSHFTTQSTVDWGEEDAWDSASDSESPSAMQRMSRTRSGMPSTAPRPVPRPAFNASSSTLSSSYTHLHAPSSYNTQVPPPTRNGWTMVRKSRSDSIDQRKEGDVDVEGDMIIGDMDQEGMEQAEDTKSKQSQGNLRDDFNKIIHGKLSVYLMPSSPTSHQACQILFISCAVANLRSLWCRPKRSLFQTVKSQKSFYVNVPYARAGVTNLSTA